MPVQDRGHRSRLNLLGVSRRKSTRGDADHDRDASWAMTTALDFYLDAPVTRNASGVAPYHRLKARWNGAASEYPRR